MDKNTKVILLLAIIVIIVATVSAFTIIGNHSNNQENTTVLKNNTTTNIANVPEDPATPTSSEDYGHCAICGASLTKAEASNSYTDGKLCTGCANNPYYTNTREGADYANEKLDSVPINPWVYK